MLRLFLAVALTLIAVWGASGQERAASPARADLALAAAEKAGLGGRVEWLRLGHYRPRRSGGWKSQVDGPLFFLSPAGKNDPRAELEATLRALLAPAEESLEDEHALCRFPARARWLGEKLGIHSTELPAPRCPKLDAFKESLDPASATLIFSSYYLNNPVSAFGHTFLRINSQASRDAPGQRELLDFGVDYAAVSGKENALLYAVKGLVGLFPGKFSAMPYFYKVRKYSDMEARDIWAYDLDLTAEQTAFLVEHLWELGQSYIDYWYLTENCSYHMLGAVEVVHPDFRLLDRLSFPVLPSDTVKAVAAEPGLVRKISYRPSIRSQFRLRTRGMEQGDLHLLARLARGEDLDALAALPKVRAARVLDAAADLVEVQHFRELVEEPTGAASQLKQQILTARAVLGVPSAELPVVPPSEQMPQLSHGPHRVGAGFGYTAERGAYLELSGRLSMHDGLDPAKGYPASSSIEFFPVRLQYLAEARRLRLEEGYAMRVASLSPREHFEAPLSWKLGAGATTIRDAGCDGLCTALHLGGGAGVTQAWAEGKVLGSATLDTDLLASARLEGLGGGPVRVGLGPWLGLRWRVSPESSGAVSAKWSVLPGQTPWATWKLAANWRGALSDAVAVDLQAERYPSDTLVSLQFLHYF